MTVCPICGSTSDLHRSYAKCLILMHNYTEFALSGMKLTERGKQRAMEMGIKPLEHLMNPV